MGVISNEQPSFRCKKCATPITTPDNFLSLGGNSPTRLFTNPAGHQFLVGTFSSVPGGITSGEPTTQDSWFEGFEWRYTHCCSCNHFIGWYYNIIEEQGDEKETHHDIETFFGLILTEVYFNTIPDDNSDDDSHSDLSEPDVEQETANEDDTDTTTETGGGPQDSFQGESDETT